MHVPNRTLLIQTGLLAVCVIAVAQMVINFPFPSPLIKPMLPPNLRWPTAQIQAWVESGNFGGDFLEFFARDPERTVPLGQNIVSPSDGNVQGTPFQDGITYLVVGLSFWDVHVVRTPIAGTVKSVEQEGLHFTRNLTSENQREMVFLRGKDAPVQQIVTLDTTYGEIKIRLITSYWASRIKVWVTPGQSLMKGERIGRILLGSTVAVEFPGNIQFAVRPRQQVIGGETIIYDRETLQ
jgi:phosphatidylserine decarboxylase